MIYTGYFAKHKGDDGIAICLYPPKYFKGRIYKALAPTDKILEWWNASPKDAKSQSIYRKLYYRDVLNHLDVNKVAQDLDNKTLLCYEKPGVFCHRQLVAEWLRGAGHPCQEEVPMTEQELYKFYGELYQIFGEDLEIKLE